jgi:hypothetical protein
MQILGWTMVVLMLGAIAHNLRTSQSAQPMRKALLIAAIVSVNIMSALDAASTIYLVAHDYSREINPVMNALMEQSYLLFVGVKVSITIAATLVCWRYYDRKQSFGTILRVVSRTYCVLMAWHCLLLSSVLL